jgi:small subunit ribosomal protein S21
LAQVIQGRGENFDNLLKRFTKKVQQDGVLSEIRKRAHFEPPSIKRKKERSGKTKEKFSEK